MKLCHGISGLSGFLVFLPLFARAQVIAFADLNPTGSIRSEVYSITGNQQTGNANTDCWEHAGLWYGTAGSFVDLNPPGFTESYAYAMTAIQQVGYASRNSGAYNAGLWSGTADSFVNLHPAGASYSFGLATTGNQQAGRAVIGGDSHAGLWFGTAASFVDLNPAEASRSWASATTGQQQAGRATIGGIVHAGLWFGTAESFVDLQTSLGPDYRSSQAEAIWTDGSMVLVAGSAYHVPTSGNHAILWTIVSEPSSTSLVLATLVGLGLVHHNRKKGNGSCRGEVFSGARPD